MVRKRTHHDQMLIFIVKEIYPCGVLTRNKIVKEHGFEYFENRFLPKFGGITVFGLLLTLQTFLIFFIAYLASRALGLPHNIAAPAGMIGASNFFELAVAVAISLSAPSRPQHLPQLWVF